MNTITKPENKILTIEMSMEDSNALYRAFKKFEQHNPHNSYGGFLKNAVTTLSMCNGNTLLREFTMNSILANTIEGHMIDMMKWARKQNKEYAGWNGVCIDEDSMKLLRKFQKLVKSINA